MLELVSLISLAVVVVLIVVSIISYRVRPSTKALTAFLILVFVFYAMITITGLVSLVTSGVSPYNLLLMLAGIVSMIFILQIRWLQ